MYCVSSSGERSGRRDHTNTRTHTQHDLVDPNIESCRNRNGMKWNQKQMNRVPTNDIMKSEPGRKRKKTRSIGEILKDGEIEKIQKCSCHKARLTFLSCISRVWVARTRNASSECCTDGKRVGILYAKRISASLCHHDVNDMAVNLCENSPAFHACNRPNSRFHVMCGRISMVKC